MTTIREMDLAGAGWPDVPLQDLAGFMASELVLELGELDAVQAAFPDGQAELVATELEQLAAEVTGRQRGTVRVVRLPHRPGWTRVVLCAEEPSLR